MPRNIAIDFETFYSEEEGYSIKTMGAAAYIRDARFDPYFISVCDGSETWAGPRSKFNWDALDGATLLAHNAGFDSRVYQECVKRGLAPQLNIPAWHCTANMSAYFCMRRNLTQASEFLLGQTLSKDVRTDADGKHWADIVKCGGAPAMIDYAKRDALACYNLFAKYGHLWPEFERKISDWTIRACQRGIQIDEARLRHYLYVTEKAVIQAESVLPWVAHGRKPTSPKAIAEECRKHGIPTPPVKKHEGEAAYDEWEEIYSKRFEWVGAFSSYRKLGLFLDKLQTIRDRTDEAGIFYFDLLYFGAHTGRWSGSGGFNMQNLRSVPLYLNKEGRLISLGGELDEIEHATNAGENLPDFVGEVLDIRALFIARPGKKMILSDLSQIEPRVLCYLVGDNTTLELLQQGQSPYEAHARSTMNWTGGKLKDENPALYKLAKARVLGLGYGCGWEKFITVARDMAGLDICADDPQEIQAGLNDGTPCWNSDGSPMMVSGYGSNSKRIVKEYRQSNPLIAAPRNYETGEPGGLWAKLEYAFKQSIGSTFEIELPTGRIMRYPEVRQEYKAVQDPDNPKKWSHRRVTTALMFDTKTFSIRRTNLYGGKLTENLVQATAREVFAEHLLALDAIPGVDVLFPVHDEAVCEVDENITAEHIEKIMSVTPAWLKGCPIAAEAKEVKHYLK